MGIHPRCPLSYQLGIKLPETSLANCLDIVQRLQVSGGIFVVTSCLVCLLTSSNFDWAAAPDRVG
jgi:hypothetical protein